MNQFNWKTTTWGIVAALALIANAAINYHTTGHLDFSTVGQLLGAFGIGGIGVAAADGKK